MFIYIYNLMLLISVFVHDVSTETQINIPLKNLLRMQQGNGWPQTLHVMEGHEALLNLKTSLEGQINCIITTPSGLQFDVSSPPSNRYERLTDADCGVRVKNIGVADTGRWRITSATTNDSITGWSEVTVTENVIHPPIPIISLHDGDTKPSVNLTDLSNSYCLVTQPFSQSSLIPGHCNVTLEKATRVVQGNWGVVLGLPGRVSELQYTTQVEVKTERLDFGFTYDSNEDKLNLYCNILNSDKNITFCRFQKTNSATGFNVADGLSDGRHSYYGEGFLKRECGMSIKQPTNNDYGTWQCSVGVQQWVGKEVKQQTPMQALITLTKLNNKIRENQAADDSIRTIFAQKDISSTFICKAEHSLKYCWFEHVNTNQYTPGQKVDDDQSYWYSGAGLQTGDCGISFNRTTEDMEGLWLCHMGPVDQVGIEITDKLQVRVTGPIAANSKKVGVNIGRSATLYCHTSNGRKPLEYCRFVSPSVLGISIDSTVTAENAILGRYYFTENRSLDYGDCSLTIASVTSQDIGQWTCAALVHEEVFEASDVMVVYIDESAKPSQAGIIGMSVGLVILAIVLVGYFAYKRGLPSIPWKKTLQMETTSSTGEIPMDTLSSCSTDGNSDIIYTP